MPLKFQLDSLEGVPEEHQSLYEEKEGKFYLAVDGATSKEKLDEFRTSNIRLMKERDEDRRRLEQYKDIDLEQYQTLLADAQALKEKKMIDEGKIEEMFSERTKKMTDEHAKELKQRDERLAALTDTLNKELITNRLQTSALEAKIRKEAVQDAVLLGERTFRLDEQGVVVALDPQGNKLYGKDGELMTMQEWFDERHGDRPHWFEASSGGGAQHSGATNTSGARSTNTKPISQWSDVDKVKYIGEHGQEAYLDLVRTSGNGQEG